MPATFDDLYQLFYVAAYGCNTQCDREIRKACATLNHDTPFLFFEFFLSQPLTKTPKPNRWSADWEEKTYVLAPFAPRLLEHLVVVPDAIHARAATTVNRLPPLRFRCVEALRDIRLSFQWKHSAFARAAWNEWAGTGTEVPLGGKARLRWSLVPDNNTGVSYEVGLVDDWTLNWQLDDYPAEFDALSRQSNSALAGLYYALFPLGTDTCIPAVFIPIASSRLFYGGVWVMLPGLSVNEEDTEVGGRLDNIRSRIGLQVAKIIDQTYLPVLSIIHEHWLERLHADVLPHDAEDQPESVKPHEADMEFDKDISFGRPIRKATVTFRNSFSLLTQLTPEEAKAARPSVGVADDIEELFRDLWSRRDKGGCWYNLKGFKESLVFKAYLVCSQSMVQLLHKVIIHAKSLRKSNDTLPGCLIVGGAGSGKEKLAKMIRLFSKDSQELGYCDGKEHVVNLAAIRPAPLTAAVIAGIYAKGSFQGDFEFKLQGMLGHIRDEALDAKRSPTLILDEFNSMDPDSQGVLLRFMDNSEIVPIGERSDAHKKKTNCLVIGIMNEDPEDISRERAMEFFRSGQYLGNFLGDLLYEHFLRIRRLRPDVMYRMIRNGKFVIPDLRNRREDIPLLLYVYVCEELRGNVGPEPQLHISLDALGRLVDSRLLWPGNVRQLQALAKLIGETLKRRPKSDDWHVITLPILGRALQELGLQDTAE